MDIQNDKIKIGVVSIGLIGGSIVKTLKKQQNLELYAYTRNTETVDELHKMGVSASNDIETLKTCDVVIICSPISETIKMISAVAKINPDAIILDTASVKEFILNEVEENIPCKFIGSHPMAGKEISGFNSSDEVLFKDAKWVLTPSKYVSDNDIKFISELLELTGAKILISNAQEHDKAVSLISHAPLLISQALMKSVQDNELAKKLASSGFRDMTRLAVSNKIMAKDMYFYNKENIEQDLKSYFDFASDFLTPEYFAANIDDIISLRKSMYNSDGKNVF